MYYYSSGSNHSTYHKSVDTLNRIISKKPQQYQYSFLTEAQQYKDIIDLQVTRDAIERIYYRATREVETYCRNLLIAQEKF